MALSVNQVARIAHDGVAAAERERGVPFNTAEHVEAIAVMIAISGWKDSPCHGESAGNPIASGDEEVAGERTANGKTWGPSIGLMQIRSVDPPTGADSVRNRILNLDPITNMKNAWLISNRGTDWSPWTCRPGNKCGAEPGCDTALNLPKARAASLQVVQGGAIGDLDAVIPGPVGEIADAIDDAFQRFSGVRIITDIVDFLNFIIDGKLWSRIGWILAGSVLVFMSLSIIADSLRQPNLSPARRTKRAVKSGAKRVATKGLKG